MLHPRFQPVGHVGSAKIKDLQLSKSQGFAVMVTILGTAKNKIIRGYRTFPVSDASGRATQKPYDAGPWSCFYPGHGHVSGL